MVNMSNEQTILIKNIQMDLKKLTIELNYYILYS